MSIHKLVLPIAGLGTRFLPVTKVMPKEMLPIQGKPIVQLLVEEAYKAGITEVIFVINKEKEAIIKDYFKHETPTSRKIKAKGKEKALEELNHLIHSIKFHYVIQHQQKGDGHAVLQAAGLIEDGEPFAVMFGDDIVIPRRKTDKSALKQLIDTYNSTKAPVIALEKIPRSKTDQYGIVKPKSQKPPVFDIESLVEKPKPAKAPSTLGIIGKYVVTHEIFAHLKKIKKGSAGEIRLIDGFKSMLKTQKITGLQIKGKRYDTGTLDGYKKAISEN